MLVRRSVCSCLFLIVTVVWAVYFLGSNSPFEYTSINITRVKITTPDYLRLQKLPYVYERIRASALLKKDGLIPKHFVQVNRGYKNATFKTEKWGNVEEFYQNCLATGEQCDKVRNFFEEFDAAEGDYTSDERPHLWSLTSGQGYTLEGQEKGLVRRLPHVLIIGAKKGGTRALLEFLRIHPSIRAAGKELHFFDKYFYMGPSWYRSQLPASLEGQLTVEKTPAYFVAKEVPSRVKELLPNVKLLLVVRDPVTRAISDYVQSKSKHEPRKSFTNLALKNSTTGLVNVAWGPVSGGLYIRHLQQWLQYFPISAVHVVSGEGLVAEPAQEMQLVEKFLGIKQVITKRHFFFNATKGFPCLVKWEDGGKPHCLGSTKGRPHPEVSKDTVVTLKQFFRPFNIKFYKTVGRNFGWDD